MNRIEIKARQRDQAERISKEIEDKHEEIRTDHMQFTICLNLDAKNLPFDLNGTYSLESSYID